MRKKLYLITYIFITIVSFSHPHVFVDTLIVGDFNEKGLKGIEVRWVYDEMYSALIEMITGRFGLEKFTDEEIELIRKEEFELLKNENYRTKIKINGEDFPVKNIDWFKVRKSEEYIVFSFYIPLNIDIFDKETELIISIYDKEYYTDYYLIEPNPIIFNNNENYNIDVSIQYNEENAYYFEQIYPEEIVVKIRRD